MIKDKPYFEVVDHQYTDRGEGWNYCKFHKVRDHSTEICFGLKNLIQRLINEGKLKEHVDLKKDVEGRDSWPPKRQHNKVQLQPEKFSKAYGPEKFTVR